MAKRKEEATEVAQMYCGAPQGIILKLKFLDRDDESAYLRFKSFIGQF